MFWEGNAGSDAEDNIYVRKRQQWGLVAFWDERDIIREALMREMTKISAEGKTWYLLCSICLLSSTASSIPFSPVAATGQMMQNLITSALIYIMKWFAWGMIFVLVFLT